MAESIVLEGVGERIREERLKRLWTIGELAARANLSRERVGQWESGGRIPSLLTIYKLASALELEPVYLAYGITSNTYGTRNTVSTSGVESRTLSEPNVKTDSDDSGDNTDGEAQ